MWPLTLRHSGLLLASFLINAPFTVAQAPYGTTVAVLDDWIANTDASLTFRGAPRGASLGPFDARVIWCSTRTAGTCGGQCTVYTGPGNQCFATSGTSCVAATVEIVFCASGTCVAPCNLYRTCGTRMDSGFCWTPGTGSVQIPTVEGPTSISSSSSTPSSSSSTPEQEPSTPPPTPTPTPSTEEPPPSSSPDASPEPSSSPSSTPSSSSSRPRSASSSQHSSSKSDAASPTGGVPADGNSNDNSSNSEGGERKNAFPIGAIIGIVLGTLVIICATILIIFWLRWKQQREQRASDDLAGTTVPFMQTSPSLGSHPSTPGLLSYTSGPSNGHLSPALIPPAGTAHSRSTSDITSTASYSTLSRPLRKGEAVGVPVSRPADNVPPGQFVVVHADSGLRPPQSPNELPPMYTPS